MERDVYRLKHPVRFVTAVGAQRIGLADGVLDPYEDMLLRQIAGLIQAPDKERGTVRQRALEQLKASH